MPNNFDKLFNQAQGNELINALKGIKSSLDVNYPLETVNVTLSNNAQNITPSENYYGLGQVNVPGMNLSDMTILVNGNYDPVTSGLDGYGKLNVNVPTWGQADEGKVVSNNALVPQTNREVNANGTYDTTLNNSVLVNVPNTYGSEDEGKVVMNNALVPQTNRSITENGTYDTTTNDEVVVNVEGGGSGGAKNILGGTTAPTSADGTDGDIYIRYGHEILSDFQIKKESSMTITANDSNIVFDYTVGSTIGGQVYKQFDLTNIDTISFSMTSGSHTYNNYQTPKFCPLVIIENTLNPASNFVADSVLPVEGSRITANNTNVTMDVDVSSLTGNYWIVFCSYGCDSTVDYLYFGEEEDSIVRAYLKVDGDWIILEDGDWSEVNTEGGSGKLYTNSKFYESDVQITDVTGFTKVYNTSVRYGNNGSNVSARLDVTSESAIETFMQGGWNANGMAYYDAENLIGAYGGYDFGEELTISKVKLWIGRYSGQNTALNVTIQWLDENGDWNDVVQNDLVVSTYIPYPVNTFECNLGISCYGIRWIHKNAPNKTGGNNITFAGMTLYKGTGESIDVYVPTQTGLIQVPPGYDGFGPLYITQ